MPSISTTGAERLQAVLDKQAQVLPCSFLTVVDADKVLFDGCAGIYDPLEPNGKKVGQAKSEEEGDTMFFASTTKLITSITYLQLVDRGIISLDTDMRKIYEPLAKASSRLFVGIGEDGEPQYKDNDTPVTLLHMMNQSSGVGMEFGDLVQSWKEYTRRTGGKGGGFVNSCKVEHLINTPFTFEAGSSYEYGNSAEWLALILPTLIDSQSYESYLQEHICAPLGLHRTSFFPFDGKWQGRLLPTRWGNVSEAQDKIEWHKIGDVEHFRARLMNLPRSKEEIEYPVGGGGIYCHTGDYARILQHLLAHYLSLSDSSITRPANPLLSDKSVASLFKGTLDPRGYENMADLMSKIRGFGGEDGLKAGEADWTTGMALFKPDESRTGEALSSGRKSGSVGWGGAAGTEYWIDPVSKIAVCYTTQAIVDNGDIVTNAKKEIEKVVYEVLEL